MQYATKMKATPATPTSSPSKTRVQTVQSKIESPRNACELFLGNKVIAELRILMRLATPTGTATQSTGASINGHSY